ncbi:MAG: hypothetical protein PHD46_02800 [Eubacteriales bacterium]|nr:hypothetical protein [Eubacteriales bacterium]MDD4421947.1 hypothetical protein [Eubacteriales bacterium]HBR32314.1 hypothetical protein [Clostridiales bacterium]
MSEQFEKRKKDLVVNQLIKAQTQVCVKPECKHGEPKVFCIDTKIKPGCECVDMSDYRKAGEKCVFTITQLFCVEVPVSLDFDIDINEGIACCGKPEFGPCKKCIETDEK